ATTGAPDTRARSTTSCNRPAPRDGIRSLSERFPAPSSPCVEEAGTPTDCTPGRHPGTVEGRVVDPPRSRASRPGEAGRLAWDGTRGPRSLRVGPRGSHLADAAPHPDRRR